MASGAKSGIGTHLQRGDGGGTEVFSNIAEILSIGGPSQTAAFIEVTNVDSPGGYSEHITGLKDAGEISLDCNLVPQDATYKALLADFDGNVKHNYKIIFPDASTTTGAFAAFVSGLDRKVDTKNQMTCIIKFRVTGPITWTP
jgi:predicted secreted protein